MKNLISELLSKLAEKEEESKAFVVQLEALELVVTALLRRMTSSDQQAILSNIEEALGVVRTKEATAKHDFELLEQHLNKLLVPQRN